MFVEMCSKVETVSCSLSHAVSFIFGCCTFDIPPCCVLEQDTLLPESTG